jgi:putative MFS transporter
VIIEACFPARDHNSRAGGCFHPGVCGTNLKFAYDDAPLTAFHARVATAAVGGVFSDGFGLGGIGIALSLAGKDLELTPLWLGLLGGASLFGLFFGALLTGPVADQHGRRPVFAYNMLLLSLFSALPFLVSASWQLLILRLIIGFLLGTDYVVSKAMLTEFTPRSVRGRIMSSLSVAWAGGYACAFIVGVLLSDSGPDAWRWMLVVAAVPCLLVLPLRLGLPESPLWLAQHGRSEEAARIVRERIGADVQPPPAQPPSARTQGRWAELLSPRWRKRTLVGCIFFVCQVIPYFAMGTFVSRVLAALQVRDEHLGGVLYNVSLVAGAVAGMFIVDSISRRQFLIGGFALAAGAMLILTLADSPPAIVTITLFALFAGVLSASTNLVYVYLPELFTTDVRASGIGMAIAASRIGSAISTFLMPLVVANYGVHAALGACVAVLAFGGVACYLWAPETRHARLSAGLSGSQAS